MKPTMTYLAVLCLLASAAAGQLWAQEDGPRYALVAIRNTTNAPVSYFYWWGTSKWADGGSEAAAEVTLRPGASHYYAWEYQPGEEGSSPPLNVMFVSSTLGRAVPDGVPKEYSLERASAPAKEYRYYKKYFFAAGRDRRLDLFEAR